VLDDSQTAIVEERNSRKSPLTDAEARELVAAVATVWVAKGKKIRRVASEDTELGDLKGPSGNYRAPIVRAGDTLLVGFHPDSLRELIGA
jgi:hypothetical protein